MRTDEAGYVVGEYAVPAGEIATPQESKSPPLTALLPARERNLRPSAERYHDPAHAALEWDRLWTKVWLCAGRVSDLPATGAWFRFDFGRESFIVVRSSDSEITALYNVCQHRANRLIDDDFGRGNGFVCPYHSWRYDRGGRCTGVTDRELFQPEALSGSLDIPRVRCETFNGFVFINMNSGAAPLSAHVGELADILSGYRMERMEVRNDLVLDLACNWKTILDAFSENYHVHITHQFAMPITEDKIGQMDFYPGGHTRRIVALGNASRRRGEAGPINPMQRMLLNGVGIDPDVFEGGEHDVRRAIQLAKRAMEGAAGEVYGSLSDNQLTDDWAVNVFPNLHLSLHSEGALVMRYLPHRTDPNRCSLHILVLAHPGLPFGFYLPESQQFDASGRPMRVRTAHDDPDVEQRIGQLLFEDIRNTRETQLGLQSRGFDRMRLSDHEQPIVFQNAMMERYLTGADVQSGS